MEYYTATLANGIRLIHKQVNSPIAHCGLIINTGSRDEEDHEHGLAHFIEHVIFKGTKKRKAYHILSRLDDVGGEINAYTTKEETCVHASFFRQDYQRAFELISDIVFNSTFPQKELDKEKSVIIDEINSYKDSPSELIYDEFEDLVFKENPIGRSILGTKKHLKSFKPHHIKTFIDNNYSSDQMVLASVGNISNNQVYKYFEKHFGTYPEKTRIHKRKMSNGYEAQKIVKIKKTYQLHCCLGNVAYSLQDDKRLTMHLVNNILAGPNLNSRVNFELREKLGIAYNVESSYTPYTDTGVFSLYFGTDKTNFDKCIHIIHKEFKKLQNTKLGVLQLSRAKKQILGQLAISADSNESLMLSMAKSYLIYNNFPSFEKIADKIENINSAELMEVANEVLAMNRLSYLTYK